jgi:hypothetical protein
LLTHVLVEQREGQWVEKWAGSLTEPTLKSDINSLFMQQAIKQAVVFMKFYKMSLTNLDNHCATINKELKALHEKLESIIRALDNPSQEVHKVIVLLSTESSSPVHHIYELFYTYFFYSSQFLIFLFILKFVE